MITGENYKGCKVLKKGIEVKVFGHNGEGWVPIFEQMSIFSVVDAQTVIDHHMQKIENNC